MAKSHIFSKGFFKILPEYANVQSVKPNGEKLRRLPTALHDQKIICRDCESKIFSPLDDYGIKIFRDRNNSRTVKILSNPDLRIILFENPDCQKLRAFIASILWRVSISDLTEIASIDIAPYWEKRISEDLQNPAAEFLYIDAISSFYSDNIYNAFFVPWQKTIEVLDSDRDTHDVNGWVIQMPNVRFTVSLDDNPHPQRMYMNFKKGVTDEPTDVTFRTSLTQYSSDCGDYACFDTDWVFPGMFDDLLKLVAEQ